LAAAGQSKRYVKHINSRLLKGENKMELIYKDVGLVTRWAAKKITAASFWGWLIHVSDNCYQDWAKTHKFNRDM